MKMHLYSVIGLLLVFTAMTLVAPRDHPDVAVRDVAVRGDSPPPTDDRKPIPDFLTRGMEWLANAQLDNGGWGAGSHARQDIRDPHAVEVDPATTAFAAMALMRSGSTLTEGPYRRNVSRALHFLLGAVEEASSEGPHLTSTSGTQPQVKLGRNIDVSMATQFLSEILTHTEHESELHDRVAQALDKCLHKLEASQDADGSWNSRGGWAGVLQSAMANNALELAESVGRKVDTDALDRSRLYQKDAIGSPSAVTGEAPVRTEDAAGIPLYSIASSQRATAQEAKEAEQAVRAGARGGKLDSAEVSEENLAKLGYGADEARRLVESYSKNKAAGEMLASETVLSGFGNNGGEEFLSYMMTSESLVLSESSQWDDWHSKMRERLEKIQNADGSWSGHHCITSPVFCTAAVVLTLTADRGAIAQSLSG